MQKEMEHNLKHISKFMSLVLRHKPEEIGLVMDPQGWTKVEDMISKMNGKGFKVDFKIIDEVVRTNEKKRFSFNEDKSMIRASQGHSIEIDLNIPDAIPPDILFHGTTIKYLDSIFETGLKKQNRQHVHLSTDVETAKTVGSRHGKPVILKINAKAMHDAGMKFYLSENKVWLTESVPKEYITQ